MQQHDNVLEYGHSQVSVSIFETTTTFCVPSDQRNKDSKSSSITFKKMLLLIQ